METYEDYEAARIIGTRVRDCRQTRALTLESLSYLCDIHVTTVSRIERGQTLPNLGTLIRIATALDSDPGAFIRDIRYPSFSAQQ